MLKSVPSSGATRAQFAQGVHCYVIACPEAGLIKVGHTQALRRRLLNFSDRYFERFDLARSYSWAIPSRPVARVFERALQCALREHAAAPPAWVPFGAGGRREWFAADPAQALALLEDIVPVPEGALPCGNLLRQLRRDLAGVLKDPDLIYDWCAGFELTQLGGLSRPVVNLLDEFRSFGFNASQYAPRFVQERYLELCAARLLDA